MTLKYFSPYEKSGEFCKVLQIKKQKVDRITKNKNLTLMVVISAKLL